MGLYISLTRESEKNEYVLVNNLIGNVVTQLFSGVIMEAKRTCSQDYVSF